MASIKPNISVQYGEDVTVIAFTDEKILEESDIRGLQNSISSVIEQTEGIKLVMDFGSVKFLSSAVLGLLIRISKRVYEGGGQLALCSIDPKILQIFKITRLTNIFDIYDDIESATKGLTESG